MYFIKPFDGLTISITGHSIETREKIAHIIKDNGGFFSPDMTRSCTHLVAEPEGDDAVASASIKLKYARKWGVKIVTEAWIVACVRQNGRLDEEAYSPNVSCLKKEFMRGEKIHFAASNAKMQYASRIESAGGSVVMEATNSTVIIGALSQSAAPKADCVSEDWLKACFEAESIVPKTSYIISNGDQSTASLGGISLESKVFSDHFFYIVEETFEGNEKLQNHLLRLIKSCSGKIVKNSDEATFLVALWTASSVYALPLMKQPKNRLLLVSEIFVYFCAQEGYVADPEEHVLFVPSQIDILKLRDASCAEKLISLTGFEGAERDLLIRAIELCGFTYSDNFYKRCAFLVAKQKSGNKYTKAIEWKVPVVADTWVFERLSSGQSLHEHAFEEIENVPSTLNFDTSLILPSNLTPLLNKSFKRNLLSSPDLMNFSQNLQSMTAFISSQCTPSARLSSASQTGISASSCKIFDGFVFFLSQRLWHRRKELAILIQEFGGTLEWTLSPKCTHFVHQANKTNENTKEIRTAKQHAMLFVSPWWLIKCKEAQKRLNEADFPPTFIPTKTLHMKSVLSQRIDCSDAPFSNSISSASSDGVIEGSSQKTQENHIFAEISTLIENVAKRPKISETLYGLNAVSAPSFYSTQSVHEENATFLQSKESIDSFCVKYADTESKAAKLLLFGGVANSKRDEISTQITPLMSDTQSQIFCGPSESVSGTSQKVICFSSINEETRMRLLAIGERLGALVLRSTQWEPETTHLVCGALVRSEKFLAACASGCWVLQPSFMLISKDKGHFANETDYEWAMQDAASEMAVAAQFWRKKRLEHLAAESKGPFHNWNVFLLVGRTKKGSFERILRAGGGNSLSSQQISVCQYVFVECEKHLTAADAKLKDHLAQNTNILVLRVEFIAEYLIKCGKVSDVQSFCVKI